MAVFEQLQELAAHESASNPSAEKAKRERVFHPVFEGAGCGTLRLKRMRMFPVREWAGNLDIAEIAALLVVLMLGNPAPAKWPSSKPQDHARAALDSPRFLYNFHVFTRRRESFERLRQGVPGIHLGCGSLDSGTMDEDFGFHSATFAREIQALDRTGQETRAQMACNL
jgi:hypothetical protein